jgi:hypothetical protein
MSRFSIRCIAAAAAMAASLVPLCAISQDQLDADQLKTLFSDKTVVGINHGAGNKLQKTYFSAGGTMIQIATNGETKRGSWRVNDSNQHCVTWAGASEVCAVIVSRGDGTYQRLVGGKAAVTIQKVSAGNTLLND